LHGVICRPSNGITGRRGAEFLDDSVYDEEAFKKLVPAEVLVEIPALHTPQEEEAQKRWQKLSLSGVGVIGIIVMLGTAISFLRG